MKQWEKDLSLLHEQNHEKTWCRLGQEEDGEVCRCGYQERRAALTHLEQHIRALEKDSRRIKSDIANILPQIPKGGHVNGDWVRAILEELEPKPSQCLVVGKQDFCSPYAEGHQDCIR
jgi:hypothetical protein